eukprot:COSAG01_NODE_11351_length_1952_cov_28.873179_2_plen_90_part_00
MAFRRLTVKKYKRIQFKKIALRMCHHSLQHPPPMACCMALPATATMIMLLLTMALFVAATAHAGPTKPHIVFFLGAPDRQLLCPEDGRH